MRRKNVLSHLVNNGVNTPPHPPYSGANSSALRCCPRPGGPANDVNTDYSILPPPTWVASLHALDGS
jgi:hypothetical protein